MKAYLKMFPTILIGNALIALSICAFVVPHGIMLGGCNGIALAMVLKALSGDKTAVGWVSDICKSPEDTRADNAVIIISGDDEIAD